MMSGITVISTTSVHAISFWLFVVGIIFVLSALSCVGLIIWNFFVKESYKKLTKGDIVQNIVIAIVLGFFGFLFIQGYLFNKPHNEYEVKISNEVSLNEFLDKYEFVDNEFINDEHDNGIFTIRLRADR